MILPTTLTTGGALALINFWLAMRIGRLRYGAKVDIGHGGHDPLERRMRAHANFVEYAPLMLILIAVIELAVGESAWLGLAAGALVIGRVLHPFGMDGWRPGRIAGFGLTALAMVTLAVWALWLGLLTPMPTHAVKLEIPLTR
jgi:hypothetical protein